MPEISGFGVVLLFVVGAVAFLLVTLVVSKVLRPVNPTEEKQTTYESGEVAHGSAWGKFNPRFYVIALIFLLFEAELVFLFPWATVFGDEELIRQTNGLWSRVSLIETFIFIGVLAVGLAYVWAKGMFNWVRPRSLTRPFTSKIPEKAYERFYKRE